MVDPEVTVIGPLMTTVGSVVPELWHIVHVDPLLPEAPETPFGYARADVVKQITASETRAATQRGENFFRCIVLLLNWTGAGDSSSSLLTARLLAFELKQARPTAFGFFC